MESHLGSGTAAHERAEKEEKQSSLVILFIPFLYHMFLISSVFYSLYRQTVRGLKLFKNANIGLSSQRDNDDAVIVSIQNWDIII